MEADILADMVAAMAVALAVDIIAIMGAAMGAIVAANSSAVYLKYYVLIVTLQNFVFCLFYSHFFNYLSRKLF